MPTKPNPLPLPDLQARLRAVFDARGEYEGAEALGIHRQTLTRILAGLPVREGTLALLELRLRALEAEPKQPTSTDPA